jgi:methionyl-tRNA formyltransferase
MACRAVVFAYHDVGVRCLSVLLAHGVEVPLVVTHRDDPGEGAWFASVERLARERDLDVVTPDDALSPELAARVAALAPDFIFSFYYRRMLPGALLRTAGRGVYNMHGSLLPKYRGRAPVNWAVLRGERETGATLHEMVAKPDAGRIVDRMAVPILPDDLAIDVMRKVTVAAEVVLDRALPGLVDGTARLAAQDLAQGGYFGARRPEDGRINWTQGARQIHDLVRAVAPPYPGAFTMLGTHRLRLLRTRVLEDAPAARPARLRAEGEARLVADCERGGALRILDADLDGHPLSVPSFLERYGREGVRLGENQ